jgi:SAM-dependent methyltransferase
MSGVERERWLTGVDAELSFWGRYFEGSGLDWPDEYRDRLDPALPLQPVIRPGRRARVLDCAAGPATTVGKVFEGRPVELVCVDALADRYAEMLAETRVQPPVPSIQGEVEALDQLGLEPFDVVYMRFALDHCHDPVRAVDQMRRATRSAGVVVVEHYRDPDRHEDFAGLRQWALDPTPDDLIIRNPRELHSLREVVAPADLAVEFDDDWLTATIR